MLICDDRVQHGRTTTPKALDVPHVTSVILEGSRSARAARRQRIGEPAMIPTIPAVMNALYDAVGVRIVFLPATPEKVLEAIKQKEWGGRPVLAAA